MGHRLVLLIAWTVCGGLGLTVGNGVAAETATGAPTPPPGYQSLDEIKLALLAGRVKLVDATIRVPDRVVVTRGVEYGRGGDRPLKLDLYQPAHLKRPVPGLIFIHGGAWKGGKRSDYHYYGVKFSEQGYVVTTISYRLTDTAPFPAAIEDANCAVRWMRSQATTLHVDPRKIGVLGGSAGGHLALLVGYAADDARLEGTGGHAGVSSRVQAVVDLYGPADLTTPFATGNQIVIDFLGGKTFHDAAETYREASPLFHVTADDPPTLILHGTIDRVVPIAQSDTLAKKLAATGVPVEYFRVPGWPHAMDATEQVNAYCRDRISRFLKQYLPLPD